MTPHSFSVVYDHSARSAWARPYHVAAVASVAYHRIGLLVETEDFGNIVVEAVAAVVLSCIQEAYQSEGEACQQVVVAWH